MRRKSMDPDPRDFLVTLEGTDQLDEIRARVGFQVVGSVAVPADSVSWKTEGASLASPMAVAASEPGVHHVQSVVEGDRLLDGFDLLSFPQAQQIRKDGVDLGRAHSRLKGGHLEWRLRSGGVLWRSEPTLEDDLVK
jgi:hypothetical protein